MNIIQPFIAQFDHEMASTRKTLERIPEDRFSWKPHEKSSTLEGLASHIAQIPGWVVPTIAQSSLDLSPVGGAPYQTPQLKTRADVLKEFDKNVAAAKEIMPGVSDGALLESWSLLFGGNEIFTMPKIAVLRSFILSHLIHHRAQLGVYLRLNDVPHPAMYGPSADEMQT